MRPFHKHLRNSAAVASRFVHRLPLVAEQRLSYVFFFPHDELIASQRGAECGLGAVGDGKYDGQRLADLAT